MKKPGSAVGQEVASYGVAGGTISSKGQVTIPKAVRERYGFAPGTRVEFEMKEGGALVRRHRPERHPVWDQIGSLRDTWRWPKGIPHTVDAFIDFVRGGSYEELTGHKRGRRRRR